MPTVTLKTLPGLISKEAVKIKRLDKQIEKIEKPFEKKISDLRIKIGKLNDQSEKATKPLHTKRRNNNSKLRELEDKEKEQVLCKEVNALIHGPLVTSFGKSISTAPNPGTPCPVASSEPPLSR